MNNIIKATIVFFSLVFVAFFMSSCSPQMITIGGWIPTADGNNELALTDCVAINNNSGKANFGGVVDTCETACDFSNTPPRFPDCDFDKVFSNITYHDGDIRIKVKVKEVYDCAGPWADFIEACGECSSLAEDCGGDYGDVVFTAAAKIEYSSQNPKYKDSKKYPNKGYLCVVDNGEGYNGGQAEMPDFLGIILEKGVFKGYENCGKVQGNVQQDACYY